MGPVKSWVVIPFLFASFAGCVGAPVKLGDAADPSAVLAPLVSIMGGDCIQGGGNSVYPMQPGDKVGPFEAADQRPEIGNPTIGAYGMPLTGPASGIWHVTTVCKTTTFDGKSGGEFQMGWVATMIKRPTFDTDGPDLQFIVADLSFNNEPAVAAFKVAGGEGLEVSKNLGSSVTLSAADKLMHVVLQDEHHGTFDFNAELHKEWAKKGDEKMRFWMLVASDGMMHMGHRDGAAAEPVMYRPVALDVVDTANGKGVKIAGESVGTFTHLPEGHVGNPLGHLQTGFSRTVTIGPMPEGIMFDTTWVH